MKLPIITLKESTDFCKSDMVAAEVRNKDLNAYCNYDNKTEKMQAHQQK